MRYAVRTAAVALALAAAGMAGAATLKVGMAPPPLKVAKWVKGSPVAKFEPGKVYVVEFWATWCGPCKVSIPHLTEMAHKYAGKVTFTGVSVWEDREKTGSDAYMKTVDTFVKNMGPKMDYNVAVDDPKGTMASSWMEAAGQDGIPAAFVIDQKTKIAWIGHPMMGLDKVVDQVLAGKFDAAAGAKQQEDEQKSQAELEATMQKAGGLIQSGKMKEGFAVLDQLAVKQPAMKSQVARIKFTVLTQTDEPEAYKLAKSLGEGELKDDAPSLNEIAWTIVDNPNLKKPDFAIALALAERAATITKHEDPMILDTLGYAQFKSGKIDQAIATQTKAVSLIDKAGPELDEASRKDIKDRLAQFQKAKK